jgi:hypothetical protein
MSAVNYRLELPTQWSIHPVFHIDLLMPYHETPIHGTNYQHPPPDLVEGEEEYEVETVLASRRFGRGKKLQYLVKWKGYPDSDNQWINKEDIFADDAIREFKSSNPDQEIHIRRVNMTLFIITLLLLLCRTTRLLLLRQRLSLAQLKLITGLFEMTPSPPPPLPHPFLAT